MKRLLFIVICVIFIGEVNAQSISDALKYSQNNIQGTSRAAAMGNAFGSLGGDFTSVSINPAGIGVYRSGEFSITASYTDNNISADYLGTNSIESTNIFSIPSLSYVTTMKTHASNKSSLVSVNFGLGFNRLNSFKLNRYVEGHNAQSSMLDLFVENANELGDPERFDSYNEYLAWKTYMIDRDDNSGSFYHKIADGRYGQSQIKAFNQSGFVNEYNFSLGLNFNHKVYAGFSLGVHDVFFKELTDMIEYDPGNRFNNFDEYGFYTFLKTTGVGVNGKLGVIYKPVNELRLGFAIHTPTFYNLNDYYYNDMEAIAADDDGVIKKFSYNSPEGEFDYKLQTPAKAVLSASYVIGRGLISVDCDFIDYSKIKFREVGSYTNELNKEVEQYLKPVVNFHVGGEFRLNDYFSLRAGYEYLPAPFAKSVNGYTQLNGDAKTFTYSGGLGWRYDNFSVDLAYKYYTYKHYMDIYIPSSTSQFSSTRFSDSSDYLTLTFGFRF